MIVVDVNVVVSFSKTDIVTPMGDTVLVQGLSVKVGPGDHLMITGANGFDD